MQIDDAIQHLQGNIATQTEVTQVQILDFKMKSANSTSMRIVASVLLLLLSMGAAKIEAQIIEECFWECGVEYCDYLDDFCTYDCHEICYPIAKKNNEIPHGVNLNGPAQIINSITGKHNQQDSNNPQVSGIENSQPALRLHEHLAGLNREQTSNMGQLETGRIGKNEIMMI